MKNQIQNLKKFTADHKEAIIVGTVLVAASAVTLAVVAVRNSMVTDMWGDATNFIESKGLDSEFLDYIIEN